MKNMIDKYGSVVSELLANIGYDVDNLLYLHDTAVYKFYGVFIRVDDADDDGRYFLEQIGYFDDSHGEYTLIVYSDVVTRDLALDRKYNTISDDTFVRKVNDRAKGL